MSHDHGHAERLQRCLETIVAEHGECMRGFVAVAVTDRGNRPIGLYNTSTLAQAVDELLSMAAEHEPNGCLTCDAIGRAAKRVHPQWRKTLSEEGLGEKVSCN